MHPGLDQYVCGGAALAHIHFGSDVWKLKRLETQTFQNSNVWKHIRLGTHTFHHLHRGLDQYVCGGTVCGHIHFGLDVWKLKRLETQAFGNPNV